MINLTPWSFPSAEGLMAAPACVSAFQTEGKLYLILDFLRGGDLFTRLSKEVGVLWHLGGLCHLSGTG